MNDDRAITWPLRGSLITGLVMLACAIFVLPAYSQDVGRADTEVIARGLSGPAGMAVHPESGELYVAESGAGRISVIRNGSAVPVVTTGWMVLDDYPAWAIRKATPKSFWENAKLSKPAGISFSTNGHLFVVEGVPQGRLFEFIPDSSGNYTTARVLPIAWLTQNFAWDNVKVSRQGNVFICGNVEDARHLYFGSVLMRDDAGDWWVVDYGPFINFCGIDISRTGDILVVADKKRGGFSWWDVSYHVELGEIEEMLKSDSYGNGVGILPDGAFALVENKNDGSDGAVTRVDPFTGEKEVLVSGIKNIGGIITDRKTDDFFLSDQDSGTILKCIIPEELLSQRYLIDQSRVAREVREGFTPREAPGFLRDFLLKSGAFPKQKATTETLTKMEKDDARINWKDMAFSLREFARSIPLIAGKIETQPLDQNIKDPVEVIEFVIFFPGDIILSGQDVSPSMTFFSSKRRSGRVEKTRKLFNGFALSKAGDKPGETWSEASKNASLSVPLATVNMKRNSKGRNVDLVFLGLGMYSDYYLTLLTGVDNEGSVVVEDVDGNEERYKASFVRIDDSGRVFRNLIVAGFDPEEDNDPDNEIGWLNIGYSPVGSALSTGDKLKRFSSTESSVSDMIERKTIEKRKKIDERLKQETL